MITTKLTRFVRSKWSLVVYVSAGAVVLSAAVVLLAQPADDPPLGVLKMGLGYGTVTSVSHPGIICGSDCDQGFAGETVELRAVADTGSTFLGWRGPDCSGTGPCSVTMGAPHFVRAEFGITPPAPTAPAINPLSESDLTPEGIDAYLANPANRHVNTPARFISALPPDYRQNWILMSRSESLQTGTARSPRILLQGASAQNVFTIGMTPHSSYPGSDKNAIEYMQWDNAQKNFRFHEIVLENIGPMIPISDVIPPQFRIPARGRDVYPDDAKCPKCHSTRNVYNVVRPISSPIVRGSTPGTDGNPVGSVLSKNKPNWDAYDSWGGMMPFNRDRIYQGSVEEAAFRHIFNLWNWRNSPEDNEVRQVIELLELQPPHVLTQVPPSPHSITRNPDNVTDADHITFGFSLGPVPTTSTSSPIGYTFGGPSATALPVTQGGKYVTLRHSNPSPPPIDPDPTLPAVPPQPYTYNDQYLHPEVDEGRGVELFDRLTGLNARRIADEVINHQYRTGSLPINVRPVALAITKQCLVINGGRVTPNPSPEVYTTPLRPPLTVDLGFFDNRNGMSITDLVTDTKTRSQSLPRRKADIQNLNLDRTLDPYWANDPVPTPTPNGLLQQYLSPPDTSITRIRQEIFQRPIDLGRGDRTVVGGFYVDRELYGSDLDPASSDYTNLNTQKVALYRYFLEPLGVSVDKWSMSVRGRSRAYNFADVFGVYENTLIRELQTSFGCDPAVPASMAACQCDALIPAINTALGSGSLPPAPYDEPPTYTDVQRIFNKSCIECHGALGYPPYANYGGRELMSLDLSEDESPPAGDRRLSRSYRRASGLASSLTGPLYRKITDYGRLTHPYDPLALAPDERCPNFTGLMPCGGPPLSKADILTIRRWIEGPPVRPSSEGDPHIRTINGVDYDFQGAGEFVLLRGEDLEIQTRQTPVETESALGPNLHTGLSSCVSLNTAVAVRVGGQRITYQPNISGRPDPTGLQLRIDGKLTTISDAGIPLQLGGRIIRTTAPGGIQIEAPGGTAAVITPALWDYHLLWHLNIGMVQARATEGIMGMIATGNWLPALPDGSFLGPRPDDSHQRYVDLYEKFGAAWRVNDSNTLFDYAPGTSTRTFAVENWPAEKAQQCTAPQQLEGTPAKPPLKTLALDVAQQLCGAIVDAGRKANCVQDVMVTGEPGFAKSYLLTEQIELNKPPAVPELGSPADNQDGVAIPVTFTWNHATDADGDVVTYRHCVWAEGEQPDNNKCEPASFKSGSRSRRIVCALVVILAGCLLITILIFMGLRRRHRLLLLVALGTVVAAILAFYFCGTSSTTVSKTASGLQPGKAYFWKVIADDGKGRSTESETRRFTTK